MSEEEGTKRMTVVTENEERQAAASVPQAAVRASSAGAYLREARMARGLHIAVLAAQLKVPQAKLEALEAERYAELPDATFARALAKAMCQMLKVDAAPVLALLPQGQGPALDKVSRGINQPFRDRELNAETAPLDWLRRPVIWAPLLILLAALAVYLWPQDLRLWPETVKAPVETAIELPAAAPLPAPAAAQQAAPLGVPAVAAAASVAASTPATPPAALASIAAEPVVVQSPLAQPAAAVATTAALGAPAAGEARLALRTSDESWVEVTDAQAQVRFSRLMRAGEQVDLNVLMPARLRIGNVAGTTVQLRGSAVDLQSRARDNVARLELN